MAGKKQTKTVRVGIIGSGPFIEFVGRCWQNLQCAQIVALCDADKARVELSAQKLGVSSTYADFQEMIEKAGADAIEIHSPPNLHYQIVKCACEHAKHVAIHKPLALSMEDAQSIAVAVKNAGITAMMIDPLLFHPFVRRAKSEIDKASIGEVQSVRIKSHVAGSGGLGPVFDSAQFKNPDFHPLLAPPFDKIALAEYLCGPIEQVFGYSGNYSSMVTFKFEAAGRYGIHEAIFSPDLYIQSDAAPVDHSVEITGTDGIIWIRNLTAAMIETPKFMLKRKSEVTIWDDRVEYNFENLLTSVRSHFVKCITGEEKPFHTIAQGERALAVNMATQKAIKEGRAIRI